MMNVDVFICGPEFTQCKTCWGEKQDWMKGRSSLKSKNQRAALKKWKADSKRSLHQPLGVDTNIQPLALSLPSRPATDLPTEWAESKHQSAEDQLGIGSNKSKQAAPHLNHASGIFSDARTRLSYCTYPALHDSRVSSTNALPMNDMWRVCTCDVWALGCVEGAWRGAIFAAAESIASTLTFLFGCFRQVQQSSRLRKMH